MATKSKVHQVLVTVRFDQPVTRGVAVSGARNYLYGDFFAGNLQEMAKWGKFRVGKVVSAPEQPKTNSITMPKDL